MRALGWVLGTVLIQATPVAAPAPRRVPAVVGAPRRPVPAPCAALTLPQLHDRLPFGPGERLSYAATVNGLPAAQAHLHILDRQDTDAGMLYPAEAKAHANPVLQLWAQMNSELITQLDPQGLTPRSMKSVTHSEKYTFEEDLHFGAKERKVEALTKVNGSALAQTLAVEGDVVDALSVVYYARSREFHLGQSFCLDLYQSRLIWRVRGTVEALETVDTEAGPFEAYVARGVAQAQGPGTQGQAAIIKEARPFTLWMTADGDRIPVLLKAPTPLGEVVVKLTRFEQGRKLVRGHGP